MKKLLCRCIKLKIIIAILILMLLQLYITFKDQNVQRIEVISNEESTILENEITVDVEAKRDPDLVQSIPGLDLTNRSGSAARRIIQLLKVLLNKGPLPIIPLGFVPLPRHNTKPV